MEKKTPGIARWPRIRLAISNINKEVNKIGLGDDNFADQADAVAARLDATSAHLKTLAKERRRN